MIANIIVPAVVGTVIAAASLVGLVSSQTAAPATNPANQEIITYGDR